MTKESLSSGSSVPGELHPRDEHQACLHLGVFVRRERHILSPCRRRDYEVRILPLQHRKYWRTRACGLRFSSLIAPRFARVFFSFSEVAGTRWARRPGRSRSLDFLRSTGRRRTLVTPSTSCSKMKTVVRSTFQPQQGINLCDRRLALKWV